MLLVISDGTVICSRNHVDCNYAARSVWLDAQSVVLMHLPADRLSGGQLNHSFALRRVVVCQVQAGSSFIRWKLG